MHRTAEDGVSLEARVALRKGTLDLDVGLTVEASGVVVLLGPNAAGKTTLLRALAGLVPLERGRVVLDGEVLEDTAAGVRVPTERRPIGVVFQDYLLFPHMTSLENVAFGLRARGTPRATARARAHEMLDRVGLAEAAGARPRALSGGQAQRVALARALATDPRLLLLDEPLAAMDAGARAELRRGLTRHLAAFPGTCLVITHDPIEAMTLGDKLVVLEAGRVVQAGTPEELSSHPRSRYVADLLGLNLYRGRVDQGAVRLTGGQRLIAADPLPQGEVFAVVPPRAVALHRTLPDGSPRNVWRGEVQDLDVVGNHVRAHVAGELPVIAEVTPGAVASLRLDDGGPVYVAVKAMEIEVYEA
ncbi:MAG: ABC transporter ATP-binding protein [Actinobacteria bacterium]|nr:ABC transporter ATP-binding protein [Actinomycetota bacterium]